MWEINNFELNGCNTNLYNVSFLGSYAVTEHTDPLVRGKSCLSL